MSLPASEQPVFQTSKLIIEDHPYQFLPNLAAIYGDTCAVILQQLHWTIQRPYFEGERLLVEPFAGLVYIRLFPFMWFDTLEGITKHLAKSTFYRYRKSLEDSGALVVVSSLGDKNPNSSRRNDEAAWYAINHEVVGRHDAAYRDAYEKARDLRAAQRAQVRYHDKDAHWRPAPGDDVSKQLDHWRACLSEHCDEDEDIGLPKARMWGGKREKTVIEVVESGYSQLETEPVSVVLENKIEAEEDVNLGQSQVGNGSVSVISEPQLETEPVSSWELSESQVGNEHSANLGFTPYKQTLSLESDTEDTASPNLSSADADAAVKSKLILSDGDSVTMSETKRPQAAEQIALPETAATALPSPSPQSLAMLAAHFVEVASDEYGLQCDERLAARIVSRSPVATLSDAAIARLIGSDHAEGGLDKPLFGEKKRAMLADVPALRWQLFVWPAHRAEVEAWAARKNRAVNLSGAFITKWEENQAPPRDWIVAQIQSARAETEAERVAEQEGRANAAWSGLGEPQKAALVAEAQKRVDARGTGNFNEAKARLAQERRALLLDEMFVASLNAAPAAPVAAPPTAEVQTVDAPYQPVAAELGRMELQAVKLARRVIAGEFDLDGAQAAAQNEGFWNPKQAKFMRGLVETIAEQFAMKEAA